MKKIAVISSAVLALGASHAALAHTGHVAETAGHSHWLGLSALALAALVAVPLALRSAVRRLARSRNG